MVKKTVPSLPPGVLVSDTKWPDISKYNGSKNFNSDEVVDPQFGDHGALTFYEVKDRKGFTNWYIATLGISRGKQGRADRTYAVRIKDGALGRIGNGPHVLQTVKVYVRKGRAEALKKYLDLYTKGAGDAGMVRDRISSRRAQGQLERAAGHRSWRWDV